MADKALADMQASSIDSILHEQRSFPPPEEFSKQAHIKSLAEYERLYKESIDDPEEFWAASPASCTGSSPGTKCSSGICPWAKWFVGGKINLSYNCLDRHVATWRKNKAAIIWEGEPGEVAHAHLSATACARSAEFANVLKSLGIKKGDRVAIYMGMMPELAHRDAGLRAHRRRRTP